jgi:hypothetical protein
MAYGTVNAEQMTTQSGFTLGAGDSSSFKNRLINGGMTIDQRNNGSSFTVTGSQYTLDRWLAFASAPAASKFSVQQSSTVPAGFSKSLLCTSLSAYSIGAAEICTLNQLIEGYNFADLNFGTADAKSFTLSFWVRSSLTGTFSAFFANSSQSRWYVAAYTVNSANTWEFKTITVPGDTGGTWLTTTGTGLFVGLQLAIGSDYTTTASSGWSGATTKYGVTGAQSLVGTSGATISFTGVQLEVGTVATSFDFRSIGTELALCQRYFYQWSAANAASAVVGSGQAFNATQGYILLKTAMTMRIPPVTFSSAGSFGSVTSAGGGVAVTALSLVGSWTNENMITLQPTASGWASGNAILMNAGADAACRLNFSAEL